MASEMSSWLIKSTDLHLTSRSSVGNPLDCGELGAVRFRR